MSTNANQNQSAVARVLPCFVCDGDGREWASRYGGNDPDVWVAGPCQACGGSGDQTCEDCGIEPAVERWRADGRTYVLCLACRDAWASD